MTVPGLVELAIALLYLYFGDTTVRQVRRLRVVNEHLPQVTSHLEQDPRFRKVRVGVYTGEGGAMVLHGTVGTREESRAVEESVRSLDLPVTLVNRVTVETSP